jgi:hypothetical protein
MRSKIHSDLSLPTNLPKLIRDIAWKAQERLCRARWQAKTVVCAVIVRELAGFAWTVATEMRPANGTKGTDKPATVVAAL